jgi:SOS-response transcriptional repressor LexA
VIIKDEKLHKLINDGADRYFSANNKDLSVIPESQAKIIGKFLLTC